MMFSGLYAGKVMHTRFKPRRHRLGYKVFSLLLDLDELETLDKELRLFSFNRAGLLSFHEADHGDGGNLREWVAQQLKAKGIDADGSVRMLCYPRMLGYVFNPLTVYFCHDRDGALKAIIHEVHNTYHERHAYVLRVNGVEQGRVHQTCEKALFVSPFVPMACNYAFDILPPDESIEVVIRERDAEGPLLVASFAGKRELLTDKALLGAILRHPLMTLKVTLGIHYEAIKLLLKGLRLYPHTPRRSAPHHTARDRKEHPIGQVAQELHRQSHS